MSLQSTYANKKSDYQNTFNSLQKVNAGKPRQLKYKHITFCNLSAKKDWIARQQLTLRLLSVVIERLASKIYISKAA